MIKSKREKSEKKKHLFPSKWLRDLGCCYLGTSCHQQHGQREKAAEWLELCQSHGPRGLPRGSWSSGCRDATPPSRECHAGRVAGAGGQPPPPPQPCLCARRRVRAILIPAVCFVLLSCVFSVWWLAVAGFMDGVALPPSLSLQRPQPLGLRHSLFSLPPGAPRPPGGTPTAPPR